MEYNTKLYLLVLYIVFWPHFCSEASHGQCCTYGLKTTLKLLVHVLAIMASSYLKIVFQQKSGLNPPLNAKLLLMMVMYFIIGLIFIKRKKNHTLLIYFLFNCLYALLGYNVGNTTIRIILIFADCKYLRNEFNAF